MQCKICMQKIQTKTREVSHISEKRDSPTQHSAHRGGRGYPSGGRGASKGKGKGNIAHQDHFHQGKGGKGGKGNVPSLCGHCLNLQKDAKHKWWECPNKRENAADEKKDTLKKCWHCENLGLPSDHSHIQCENGRTKIKAKEDQKGLEKDM